MVEECAVSYRTNVRAWWAGFNRFHEITDWKPGWGPDSLRWRLLYWANYGTRVLTGGPCVSWSRYWYERRQTYGHAGFMTRLLNHIQENHGARAGGPLWGTQDTAWAVAGGLVFWLLGVPAIVWGAVRLVWWVL